MQLPFFSLPVLDFGVGMANRKPKKGKGFGLTESARGVGPSSSSFSHLTSCNCNVNVNAWHMQQRLRNFTDVRCACILQMLELTAAWTSRIGTDTRTHRQRTAFDCIFAAPERGWARGTLGLGNWTHCPRFTPRAQDLSVRVYFNVTFWHLCSILPAAYPSPKVFYLVARIEK